MMIASPGRSFETIQTTDASPEMAMSFINRQFDTKELDNEKLHSVVVALGGRLTELELLVQKLKMGMSPSGKIIYTEILVYLFYWMEFVI